MSRLTKYEKDRELEKMRNKVASRSARFADLLYELECELKNDTRVLNDKDKTFLKLNYIKLALENWFKCSVCKVQSLLNRRNNKPNNSDDDDQISQLKKLNDVTKIDELAKEEFIEISATDELSQLILDHPELLSDFHCLFNYYENGETTSSERLYNLDPHSSAIMARVYLQAFKDCCVELVENPINRINNEKETVDAILSESSSIFIKDLILNVLSGINLDLARDQILIDNLILQTYLGGEIIGVDFVNKVIHHSINEHWQYPTKIHEAIKRFSDEHQADGMLLSSAKWEPALEDLLKEWLSEIFLPETKVLLITGESKNTANEKEEPNKVILLSGSSVVCSRHMQEIVHIKQHVCPSVSELRIFCQSALHIDCDLEHSVWHGTNLVIIADNLFVHGQRCWDVSGNNNAHKFPSPAPDGEQPGQDGKSGTVHTVTIIHAYLFLH
jgi:hypothetical protein